MLEDLDHSLPQLGAEAFEDQMWETLRYGTAGRVRDIGAKNNVVW